MPSYLWCWLHRPEWKSLWWAVFYNSKWEFAKAFSYLVINRPGWGKTVTCSQTPSSVLLEVELPIVSDSVCEAASSFLVSLYVPLLGKCIKIPWSNNDLISSEMVCAGAPGKGSCQGDSGGPLTVKNSLTSQHDLVGVVSWSGGCAEVSISWLASFSSFNVNFITGWSLWCARWGGSTENVDWRKDSGQWRGDLLLLICRNMFCFLLLLYLISILLKVKHRNNCKTALGQKFEKSKKKSH